VTSSGELGGSATALGSFCSIDISLPLAISIETPPTHLSLQAKPPSLLRRNPDWDPSDHPTPLVEYLKHPAAKPE
jgi:hypothetical protein